ncbi:MAG: hypothetical protein HDR28_11640 [Lachnospiraceae bacterium]|nr:hypothetical protein [Lachnospiraceae bacterium]
MPLPFYDFISPFIGIYPGIAFAAVFAVLLESVPFISSKAGNAVGMGSGYTIYAFHACYHKMLYGTEIFVFVQLYCVFIFCTCIGLFFWGSIPNRGGLLRQYIC